MIALNRPIIQQAYPLYGGLLPHTGEVEAAVKYSAECFHAYATYQGVDEVLIASVADDAVEQLASSLTVHLVVAWQVSDDCEYLVPIAAVGTLNSGRQVVTGVTVDSVRHVARQCIDDAVRASTVIAELQQRADAA